MSHRIALALGQITPDAPITIELIKVAADAPMCVINWPARPTQVSPAKLAAAVGNACRILAASSTELSRRQAQDWDR